MKNDYEAQKKDLENDLKKLKEQFLALKDSGSEAFEKDAKDIKSQVQDIYNVFREKAEDGISDLKDSLSEYSGHFQNNLSDISAKAQDRIQKKPVESILSIGLVGLLLGFLLGKKN